MTKPRIPATIVANYEAMEEQRTKVLVGEERQRVITQEGEIVRMQAVMQVRHLLL